METNKTHHDAALREALRRLDEWEEQGMTNDESGGMTNDESRFARNDESKSPSNPEGNSYSSSIIRHSSFKKIAAIFLAAAFLGGLTWAISPLIRQKEKAPRSAGVSTLPLEGERGGGLSGGVDLLSFSNLPLDSILVVVSAHYNCEVCFRDSAAMGMKFITTWNPEDSLAAFIEHLNMFDGLHLTLQDDTIFVDTDPLPAPPKGGE